MPTVTLDAGTIHYDVTGPAEGRPVVFIHGYAMAASLWGPLGARLGARGLRCFAPTWPIGSHPEPLRPGADRTLPGLAAIVDAFLAALGLDDVVLVGNDTGGLVAQTGGRRRTPTGSARSCSPAATPSSTSRRPSSSRSSVASRTRLTFRAALQPLRSAAARRRAYGALSHSDVDDLAAPVGEARARQTPAIAEDLRRADRLDAPARRQWPPPPRLGGFTRPALVAWSADDAFFPVEDGRRLATTLPNAQLHVIEGARTFAMLDQPDRLAELIGATAGVVSR